MKAADCCLTAEASVDVASATASDPVNAPQPKDDPAQACACCRGASRPVTRKTMVLMLRPELLDQVGGGQYRFCPDPDCRVVYFSAGEGRIFYADDLRVRVGLKDKGGDATLCYCFGFTESDARDEISQTGESTVPRRIASLIKEGMCACPARNPSGTCCLGDVIKTVNHLAAEMSGAGQFA
ncbi:MAG TPA: hypothetical protein VN256_21685 [Pyrinomonadaceae bacterium]|nr:hypothetical protein [Pyrinomonadaceae bacterium]